MKTISKIVIMLTLLAAWSGCKENGGADYVRLSNNSFTFSSTASEEFIVDIRASGAWRATYENGSWITVEQQDENTLKITATPSRTNGVRSAQVTITSGYAEEVIALTQLGTNVSFGKLDQNSLIYVISPNGKYVGGVAVTLENSVYTYVPYLIDTQTGEKIEYTALDYNVEAGAVSDTGVFVLLLFNGSAQYYNRQGELIDVALPANCREAIVSGISSDGEIFVGFVTNETDRLYYPVRWVNNVPSLLDSPQTDLYGERVTQGTMARGCSADGSVIYGSRWDDFTAVYWKDGGTWQYVGGDNATQMHQIIVSDGSGGYLSKTVYDCTYMMAETSNISASGRYIATTYRKITAVSNVETSTPYPAIYDIENDTFTILTELPGGFSSGTARTASNSGLLAYACLSGQSYIGYVYDAVSGTTRSMPAFVESEYGFQLTSEESYILRFAGDGEAILGGTYIFSGGALDFWYMAVLE